MWWKTIFRQRPEPAPTSSRLFDEQFLRRLERLALVASKTLRGGLTGGHRSQRRLPAPTVSDHRPYTHGDDLRYVDWNAYGRHNDLHIKMGEAEQDVRVMIVLDQSASMDYGPAGRRKSDVARQLAAAMGYVALAQGDRVRVQPFAGHTNPVFSATSRQRGAALLRFLSGLQPGGAGSLTAAITSLTRVATGGLVVVISDLWHAQDLEASLKLLRGPHWQLLVLHLLDPSELAPSLQGDVELVDSETGASETLFIDAAARARYDRRLQAWCQHLESTVARLGANYVLLTTAESLERAILPYLRTRQVLQ